MSGVCRLGDRAKAPIDVHGCPACPHPEVVGPSISASSNVYVNGQPALRVKDIGMHSSCCGTNMWEIQGASGGVFVNNSRVVRKGDPTRHCGGMGEMIEASGNVSDGSPLVMKGPWAAPLLPPLPPEQVRLFPDEIPFCPPPGALPGAPLSGDPMIYNQAAEAHREAMKQPHAEPGPTQEERIAMAEQEARTREALGIPPRQEDIDALARVDAELKVLEESLKVINKNTGNVAELRRRTQEQINRAQASRAEIQARLGTPRAVLNARSRARGR